MKIHIIKGEFERIKISNSIFTLLKPVHTEYGRTTATVDASELLGYSSIEIDVDDYKLLD